MSKVRIVIVPGNGGGDVERSNWYGWLRDKLREVSKLSQRGHGYFESCCHPFGLINNYILYPLTRKLTIFPTRHLVLSFPNIPVIFPGNILFPVNFCCIFHIPKPTIRPHKAA